MHISWRMSIRWRVQRHVSLRFISIISLLQVFSHVKDGNIKVKLMLMSLVLVFLVVGSFHFQLVSKKKKLVYSAT